MEDSREGEGDDEKKDVECQAHTWMMRKAKKLWYIRRGKTEGKEGEKKEQKKENHIFRACPKRIEGEIPRSYSRPFLH